MAMVAQAFTARRAWPDGLVVPVDREAVTRRHLERVARRGGGLTETQLRAQRALPPAGELPSAKTANLLLVGRSAQLGCPAALLLRMADGTERCMVPGGMIEAGMFEAIAYPAPNPPAKIDGAGLGTYTKLPVICGEMTIFLKSGRDDMDLVAEALRATE